MNIDLFVYIEKIFQGTILFVYKYAETLWRCYKRPAEHPLMAFTRFRSPDAREVGPVTFAAVGLFAFWVALFLWRRALSMLGGPPLEVSLFSLFAANAVVHLVVIDIAFRAMGRVLIGRSVIQKAAQNDFSENLRAVALYSAGAAGMILPLGITSVSLASFAFGFDPTEFISGAHPAVEPATLYAGAALTLPVPAAFFAASILLFVLRERRMSVGQPYFLAAAVLLSSAFVWIAAVVAPIVFPFRMTDMVLERPGVRLVIHGCKLRNIKKEIEAVVSINNNSKAAALVGVNKWDIEVRPASSAISRPRASLQSSSTKAVLDDKTDPESLLIKPHGVVYGVIRFPADSEKLPFIRGECSMRGYGGLYDSLTGPLF